MEAAVPEAPVHLAVGSVDSSWKDPLYSVGSWVDPHSKVLPDPLGGWEVPLHPACGFADSGWKYHLPRVG